MPLSVSLLASARGAMGDWLTRAVSVSLSVFLVLLHDVEEGGRFDDLDGVEVFEVQEVGIAGEVTNTKSCATHKSCRRAESVP